jgi:hypothetical protein
VRVIVQNVPREVDNNSVRDAVEKIMAANQVQVGRAENGVVLLLNFESSPGRAARRARWTMVLVGPDGQRLLTQDYNSFLPDDISTRSLTALAEAATLSVMTDIRRLSDAPSADAEPAPQAP